MMYYIRNTFCSKPKDDIFRHLERWMHFFFTVKPVKIKLSNFVYKGTVCQNCQTNSYIAVSKDYSLILHVILSSERGANARKDIYKEKIPEFILHASPKIYSYMCFNS